jgi:LmbE family N-acetylglucosaminyl deacetylase
MNSPPSNERSPSPAVLAVVAHPDDIEFIAAGTLLLLGEAGWGVHYMNLSGGDLGSMTTDREETRHIRAAEGRAAAVVRRVRPRIVLTHSPEDYMEDHMNTARLAVSAAFARGIPHYVTDPAEPAYAGDVTVYHGMPHGLRDGLRRGVTPDVIVDTTAVHDGKRRALAAHVSQKSWLDATQGMGSYLDAGDEMSRAVARMAGRDGHGEGWRRHLNLGLSTRDDDPLTEALGSVCHPPLARAERSQA